MQRISSRAIRKGDSKTFVGDAWIEDVAGRDLPGSRIRVGLVRFAPGARNAWHAHALGQTLRVLEGVGRTQVRGGHVVEIRAGETVVAEPGEWHWHGAAPDQFMTHLAMWEAPAEGAETEWGDAVSDEDYGAQPA
ncbi:MAG TPA: cupin domain-containing protein [Candidatus Limnocylindrales bacterium]|nr:cupin domain-containing protein [Candidatus Limnocylindrales bacterium]